MDNPLKILTKPEVATLFQIETRTLERWMKKGFISYFKIGNTVRFNLSDVEKHLNENCRIVRSK